MSVDEGEDLTGKKQLARNVVWSWAGHLVFVVSGFIMPRMIDEHIGQRSLGIWDLCWSLVNYIGLASFGIGTAVNRNVARYRAAGQIEELCRAISSVVVIQAVVGVLALAASAVLAWIVPLAFAQRLGPDAAAARWVVLFLGATLAVQMGLDAFRGVITGCHRWDLHNGIQSGSFALITIAMIVALMLGGGIVGLAVVYFVGNLLGELLRMQAALRVCPELRLRWHYANWEYGKRVTVFGGKSMLLWLPTLVISQTVNVALAAAMGPAALAILSRPLGLVRHAETFLNKFTYIIGPMVGSLYGEERSEERRALFMDTTRWCVAFTLPVMIGLAVLGNSVIMLWMGPHYVHPWLTATLALGMFLPVAQGPAVQILIGLDAHGRVALLNLVLVMIVLATGTLALNHFGWSIVGAGLLVVASQGVLYGIMLPAFACARVRIPLLHYVRAAFAVPMACSVPFAAVLAAVRWRFEARPALALLLGALAGGAVLLPLYWRYLLDGAQRTRFRGLLGAGLARFSRGSASA
ncbi:MAG: lipopolysaccharide biosynthesis protein [Gammaproteobacteria bacterium]|nr:lipopolysaccharide biosynthesis protein [Gammaproteobacteria bacterium]